MEKEQYIIPEYKIELLNKSKKIINKFEYINEIKNSNLINRKVIFKNSKN